ncbi:MAG: hypothetical protein AAFV80_24295, partial [Bacteroidota bacterium]
DEDLNNLLKAERNSVFSIAQLRQLWELSTNIFQYFDRPNAQMHPEFYQHPGLVMHDKPSLNAQIMYAHVHYIEAVLTQQPDRATQIMKDLIEKLESNPIRMKEDPSPLVTSMSNLIGLLLRLGQHKAIPRWLDQLRTIPQRYGLIAEQKYNARLILRIYNIELEYYRDTKAWTKAIAMIPEVQSFLEHKPERIPKDYKILISFQFAFVLFKEQQYDAALDWAGIILMGKFGEARMDIQRFARLLNLMIHYELNNDTVLKYGIQSTRRFLSKTRALSELERTLLRFFGKLVSKGVSDHEAVFIRLERDLYAERNPLTDSEVEDFLDLRQWIRSHIRSIPGNT